MIRMIKKPSVIKAAGNLEKSIEEYFGNVNSNSSDASIAVMKSPAGWEEPAQKPDFDEYTIVISGILKVETSGGIYEVKEGQAILVGRNEEVKYSTPHAGGAHYVSVCIPAFSPGAVHRQ